MSRMAGRSHNHRATTVLVLLESTRDTYSDRGVVGLAKRMRLPSVGASCNKAR